MQAVSQTMSVTLCDIVIPPHTGYIGFTLSVGPSVDHFCEHYFSKPVGRNFMKLHKYD